MTVQRGGLFVRVHMDERYVDAINAAGQGKQLLLGSKLTPAIVWNGKMIEKADDSTEDFSKWP